jgi:glycosyltransferase involved in cell wall biosynthesis
MVSVLIAVHDGDLPGLFERCLKSIAQQTFKRIETILVVDGPINHDLEAIIETEATSIPNLKVVRLDYNLGLAQALNIGLAHCGGLYVCRHDADDCSNASRVQKQYEFLSKNPNVWVVGCQLLLADESGEIIGRKRYPKNHTEIKKSFWWRNPLPHPGVMFRRDLIVSVGGYPNFRKSQDYALWGLIKSRGGTFSNLNEELVTMTKGNNFSSRRNLTYFSHEKNVLRYLLDVGALGKSQYILAYTFRLISRFYQSAVERVKLHSLSIK